MVTKQISIFAHRKIPSLSVYAQSPAPDTKIHGWAFCKNKWQEILSVQNKFLILRYQKQLIRLCGYIVSMIMRIASNRQLLFLSEKHNMTPAELSEKIIKKLSELNVFEDVQENYGITISEHLKETDIPVKPLYKFIFEGNGNQYDIKNFGELQTIGDGECPNCGGEMIFKDGEYKHLGSIDYDLEPEYETIFEKYECNICGYITTKQN